MFRGSVIAPSIAISTRTIVFSNLGWEELSHFVDAHTLKPNLSRSFHRRIKEAFTSATACSNITNVFNIDFHTTLECEDGITITKKFFSMRQRLSHHCAHGLYNMNVRDLYLKNANEKATHKREEITLTIMNAHSPFSMVWTMRSNPLQHTPATD